MEKKYQNKSINLLIKLKNKPDALNLPEFDYSENKRRHQFSE